MIPSSWIKFVSLMCIDFVAFSGNFIILLIWIKSKNLRRFQNWFILNMAFADFLQASLIMPTALVAVYQGRSMLSKKTCDAFGAIKVIITLVSVCSLSGISLQRYFYVVRRSCKMNTMKSASCCILIVWGIATILSTTPLYGWGQIGFEDGKEVCVVLFHETPSHTMFVFVIGLLLNIIIMSACYICIFRTLRNAKVTFKHDYNWLGKEIVTKPLCRYKTISSAVDPTTFTSEKQMEKLKLRIAIVLDSSHCITPKELQLLTTLCFVIIAFVACWTPYVTINTVRMFKGMGNNNLADTTSMWLGFANSALNPLIYGVLNKQFKKEFQKLIHK